MQTLFLLRDSGAAFGTLAAIWIGLGEWRHCLVYVDADYAPQFCASLYELYRKPLSEPIEPTGDEVGSNICFWRA